MRSAIARMRCESKELKINDDVQPHQKLHWWAERLVQPLQTTLRLCHSGEATDTLSHAHQLPYMHQHAQLCPSLPNTFSGVIIKLNVEADAYAIFQIRH